MHKPDQILNAASNLLGIALVVIAGLNIAHRLHGLADEIAWIAAVAFGASCALAYAAVRSDMAHPRWAAAADRCFMIGMGSLFLSIFVLAVQNG